MLATISDRKIGIDVNSDGIADFYDAETLSLHDYYPFGMQISARSFQSHEYKYGFNGMEKDDELKGEGNSYDFGARIYDSRLGRWLSRDPKESEYSWQSTYAYYANSPISTIDYKGEGDFYSEDGTHLGKDDQNNDLVYVTTQNIIKNNTSNAVTDWAKVIKNEKTKLLNITNTHLLDRANWIYAESGEDAEEVGFLYALAMQNMYLGNKKSEHLLYTYGMQSNNKDTEKLDRIYSDGNKDSYLAGTLEGHSKQGKDFWDTRNNPQKRTNAMKIAIAGVIFMDFMTKYEPNVANQWRGGKGTGDFIVQTSSGHTHRIMRYNQSHNNITLDLRLPKNKNLNAIDVLAAYLQIFEFEK